MNTKDAIFTSVILTAVMFCGIALYRIDSTETKLQEQIETNSHFQKKSDHLTEMIEKSRLKNIELMNRTIKLEKKLGDLHLSYLKKLQHCQDKLPQKKEK